MEHRNTMDFKNPYENETLLALPDLIMRPGGFELTGRLVELAELHSGARILDIGCGMGSCVHFLSKSGFRASGADKSDILIKRGLELYDGLELYIADSKKLPFEDSSFDAVLFECSLSLMDASRALKEARRVLKDGGFLLLSDVFSGINNYIGTKLTLYSLSEFSKLLTKNGFALTHTEDKTLAFESFAAQVIMTTGTLDSLFGGCEWRAIKKVRPKYYLCIAYKA